MKVGAMGLLWLMICCVLAGCTSSSRLANPLGLDFDPLLRVIDGQRPVPVVYPPGAPRTSLADSHGPEWKIMTHGYPPYQFAE